MTPVLRVLGRVLQSIVAAILLVRRPRPIHSKGVILTGTARWLVKPQASGIRFVDEAPLAPVSVLARVSRGAGTPPPLPDIVGLALRFDSGDLEFSSVLGLGVPARFMLAPRGSASSTPFSSVMPYRGAHGPVVIAARTLTPLDLPLAPAELGEALERMPWRLRLFWARPGGRWRSFAEVELHREPGPLDELVRFDAGRHPLAENYGWVQALRQPAYDVAQR